jgi:sarcosine oxidase, subunit beta
MADRAASDVIIIGGGISGTAAAYELARRGANVTLLEQGDLASMASGWTLGGVRQSGRHPAELPLARAAVGRWMVLAEELDADLEYRQDGNLRLARTPDEIPVIERLVAEQRALGLEIEFLATADAVRRIAPSLSEHVLAASYCPSDGHANPLATVRALAAAAARAGARIQTHTEVLQILVERGRVGGVRTATATLAADVVVVAAGVHTDRLCRAAGVEIPLTVGHVAVVQTTPVAWRLRQVVGVANADFAGRQEAGGRIRMTGGSVPWRRPGHPLGPEDVQPPISEVAGVLARGQAILPPLTAAPVARVWGGLIDLTPDALPVIERIAEVDGLVVAAGFSGHGFCLGPLTGRLVCDLVTAGRPSFSLEAFRHDRFGDRKDVPRATLHG